jgi:hypothetical protein
MMMVVAPLEVDGAVVAVVMAALVAMTVAVAMVMMVVPVVVRVPRTVLVPLRRGGAGNQDEGDNDETCETCLHGRTFRFECEGNLGARH